MIISMKLRLPKGVGKKTAYENIASNLTKKIHKRQLKGLIGEKYPFGKTEIQLWIEEYCFKKKYMSIADRTRNDYWGFMERLYVRIMHGYIRKDELTKDDEEKLNENEYYYPGLVYINGLGYIITNSNSLIYKYEEQRTDSLEGQKIHLIQKCKDATDFVKALPEHQRDLLSNNKENIEVT